MPRTTYDTRFFVEHYYSVDNRVTQSTTSEIRRERDKTVSSIVVHEVYRLTLQKEGRQVAQLRVGLMGKDFEVVPVDEELAVMSAEMRQEYSIPTDRLKQDSCFTPKNRRERKPNTELLKKGSSSIESIVKG